MGTGESKEGRRLIKKFQKKHRTLTQAKNDRMCERMFGHYDKGAKGYLVESEAKMFLLDTLNVSELTRDMDDVDGTVDLLWKEMDTTGKGQVQYSEIIKPSWGNIQSLLDTIYQRMNHLAPLPDLAKDNKPQTTTTATATAATTPSTPAPTPLRDSALITVIELEDKCPAAFICSITQEIMTDPVLLLETGQTYERSAIEEWLATNDHDPLTLQPVKSKTVVPILSLKQAIEEWTEKEKSNFKSKKLEERKQRANKSPTIQEEEEESSESDNQTSEKDEKDEKDEKPEMDEKEEKPEKEEKSENSKSSTDSGESSSEEPKQEPEPEPKPEPILLPTD